MKRLSLYLAAFALALVPAAIGLLGNASFSEAVPVRVPPSAQVATSGSPTPRASATSPSATTTADDHGGRTPRGCRTEAGDDRLVNGDCSGPSSSGSGSNSGSGSSGSSTLRSSSSPSSDDSGSGGHGADDSGSDDSGSGGHGSDDSGSDDSGSGSDDHGSGGHGSDD